MSKKNISPERTTLYYVGNILTGIGMLLFFSTFVSGCSNFGNFDNFDQRVKSEMGTALFGFVLIGLGQFVANIGRSGAAGSGLVLDPEKAREDLEPWSRMKGGMLKDTLDEAGINLGSQGEKGGDLPFDEELRRLEKLRQEGLLTDAEFSAAKQKILDGLGK